MSIIIGLTGQSGAGKSTAAKVFESCGFGVVDCDRIARAETADGSECCRMLAEVFPECFDGEFRMDRRRMAGIVFSDPKKLKMLTDIQYPFIIKETLAQAEELSKKQRFVMLDAPTLFESGLDKKCQTTVAVISSEEMRIIRIMNRDGITKSEAEKRLSSQHTEGYFCEKCEYIIDNSQGRAELLKAVKAVIKEIRERFHGKETQ